MWAEFFIDLKAKGHVGVFWIGFFTFPVGVLIVAFHPVWSGLPIIVTLLGYGWTIKGALYFCFPAIGARSLGRISLERAWVFLVPGVLFVILGGLMTYSLLGA